MRFGITGTQRGLTDQQLPAAWAELCKLMDVGFEWQHNGDCIGVDEWLGRMWQTHGGLLWGHPPDDDSKRANLHFNRCENVKPYLKRNKDIVNASRVLIVCPGEMTEQVRSGTWSTYRYAKRVDVPRVIVYPDGSIVRET